MLLLVFQPCLAREVQMMEVKEESFLYNGPLLSSGPVANMKNKIRVRAYVEVLRNDVHPRWAYVRFRGNRGWIPRKYTGKIEKASLPVIYKWPFSSP